MQTDNDFNEIRNRLSILELALKIGYTLLPNEGLKHPVLKHISLGDKIIITNPKSCSNQGYWSPHNDRDKGHLYHFVRNRLRLFFNAEINSTLSLHQNVMNVLRKYSNIGFGFSNDLKLAIEAKHRVDKYEVKEFVLPNIYPLANADYLQARGLTLQTLSNEIFKSRIFNCNHKNIHHTVFPLFDENENIIGIEEKNLNHKKFYPGSNRERGVWYTKPRQGKLDEVFVFEAAIDALSFYQIRYSDLQGKNFLLFSSQGTIGQDQIGTIIKVVQQYANGFPVVYNSCFDNDKAGEVYHHRLVGELSTKQSFSNIIRLSPTGKDFNEDLLFTKTYKRASMSSRIC